MIDNVLLAGDRMRIRFARRGNRWQHFVELIADGELLWQLQSDEGTNDDPWPASPAFQSLEFHTHRDGRKFALLVGMAGASHWSTSIETDPRGERLLFDVACRVRSCPQRLGSSYVLSDNCVSAEWPRIEIIAIQSTPCDSESSIQTAGRQISVRIGDLSGAAPRTVRWKYAISAAEPTSDASFRS